MVMVMVMVITNTNKGGERLGGRSNLFSLHLIEVLPVIIPII